MKRSPHLQVEVSGLPEHENQNPDMRLSQILSDGKDQHACQKL